MKREDRPKAGRVEKVWLFLLLAPRSCAAGKREQFGPSPSGADYVEDAFEPRSSTVLEESQRGARVALSSTSKTLRSVRPSRYLLVLNQRRTYALRVFSDWAGVRYSSLTNVLGRMIRHFARRRRRWIIQLRHLQARKSSSGSLKGSLFRSVVVKSCMQRR